MNTKLFENGILAAIRETYGSLSDTDSYKYTHPAQFPKGTVKMVSYIESRGGKYDEVVWVGLQAIIVDQLLKPIEHKHINNLLAFVDAHLMGNTDPGLELAFDTVVAEYNGKLPIRIRAAKEGLVIPVKNVLAVVETTVEDERIFPLTSYVEALLLRVWSPTTVATESYEIKKLIFEYLKHTADDPSAEIDLKLHDFGSRGASSSMTAALAGLGHLAVFKGSDNTIANFLAKMVYQSDTAVDDFSDVPSVSIPATEHSTTTAHGLDNEIQIVTQMFDAYAKPGAVFATVIDSRNWLRFVREIAPLFKQRLIDSGATWVFRPDSGHPVKTPIKVVEELDKVFGHTINTKGYKVLNNVAVIQGDGITSKEVKEILVHLTSPVLKWSASNMAFGMGGGLLQKNDRDTQKFAMKCCAILNDGTWVDVYKDPAIFDPDTWLVDATQSSFKKSKMGRLELLYNTQTKSYQTVTAEDLDSFSGKFGWEHALETVYESGELVRVITLSELRKNLCIGTSSHQQ